MVIAKDNQRVLERIADLEAELIKVALDLGDMDTSQPKEIIAAEYVYEWEKANGFAPKKLGAPERFNVLGRLPGSGGGKSIVFCSHLDNERREGVEWRIRDWDKPIYTRAWRDGDWLVGHGIANDRGPMACFLIAAKAIKDSGINLPGDVLLASVLGETGGTPVDEFNSPAYDAHELGARYLATHGGLADFALIAEATNFTVCPVECGFAYFKITVYSYPCTYTPFFPYPEPSMEKSVNAIFRMAKFLERFNKYAVDYMNERSYSFEGGDVVPKASVGAIRGGVPTMPPYAPEVCSIYTDFRTPPGLDVLDIKDEIEGLLKELEMDGKVEIIKCLPGFEAWKVKEYSVFKTSLLSAHRQIFDRDPVNKTPTYMNSMWRDINTYNELGVPAITYGFPTGYSVDGAAYDINLFRAKISDMIDAAKVYALLALDVCKQKRQ